MALNRVVLGSLAVNITGDSADFVRATKASKKEIATTRKAINRMKRDFRGLKQTFSGAIRGFKRIGATLAVVGAAFVGVTKKAADFGAEILENSRLTGLAVEQYQGLRRLFQGDGLGAAQAQRALQRLNEVIDDARQGKGEGLDVFKRLGIDPNSIQNTYEGILRISDALRGLSAQDRLALGADLFGQRGARAILPLAGGSQQVEEQIGYFNRILTTLDEPQLQRLKDLAQAFVNLADQVGSSVAAVVAENAAAIKTFLENITAVAPSAIREAGDAIKVFKDNFSEIVDVLKSLVIVYGGYKLVRIFAALTTFIQGVVAAVKSGGLLRGIGARGAAGGAAGVAVLVASGIVESFTNLYDSLGKDHEQLRENIVAPFREQFARINDRTVLEGISEGIRAALSGNLDSALETLTPLGYGSLSIRTTANLRDILGVLNERLFNLGETAEKTGNQTNLAAMSLAAVRAAAGETNFKTRDVIGEDQQQIFSGILPALRLSATQIVRGMFARAAGFGLEAGGGTGLFRGGGIGLDIGGGGHRLLRGLFGGATTFEGIERVDEELRRLQDTAQEVGRVFGSSFDSAFRSIFEGFNDFGSRMKALLRNLAADLVSILLSPLRQQIQNLVAGLAFQSGIFTGPGAPSIGGATPADFRSVFGSSRLFGGATTFGSTAGAAAGLGASININMSPTFNSLSAEGNRQLLGALNRQTQSAVTNALSRAGVNQRRVAAGMRGV